MYESVSKIGGLIAAALGPSQQRSNAYGSLLETTPRFSNCVLNAKAAVGGLYHVGGVGCRQKADITGFED
jgi:hypothetical protein